MVPRRRLELLHLTATASKTVMSTIPSPGLVLEMGLSALRRRPLSLSRYAFGHIWIRIQVPTLALFGIIYIMVLEMGLEPTHP
jgi:hypothetical protein